MVRILAAEDEELSVEREQCCQKLKVLENGLRELKSVQMHPSLYYKGKLKAHDSQKLCALTSIRKRQFLRKCRT
jgi:hypothetical protein